MKKILALAVLLGTVAFTTAAAVAGDGARYLPVPQRQAPVAEGLMAGPCAAARWRHNKGRQGNVVRLFGIVEPIRSRNAVLEQ